MNVNRVSRTKRGAHQNSSHSCKTQNASQLLAVHNRTAWPFNTKVRLNSIYILHSIYGTAINMLSVPERTARRW